MMKNRLPAVLLIAAIALGGCSGMVTSVSDFLRSDPWWQAAQSDSIRMRAQELEARGDLTMALDHWRLVERIDRGAEDAIGEMARIRNQIADAIQDHYQAGLSEQRNARHLDARNHFIAALRLDPQFPPALKQLKIHYWPFPLTVYLTIPGDRPDSIAQSVFGDASKGFLVAWFNDLPADKTIKAGTLLVLPRLEASTASPPADRQRKTHIIPAAVPDGTDDPGTMSKQLKGISIEPAFESNMMDARRYFDYGLYRQALDQLATVIAHQPDHQAARELAVEARFQLAREHYDNKRYLSARQVLESADPNHQTSMDLKLRVTEHLEERAQIHYRNGVKRFINEDLQAAIEEWKMALVYNPDHIKARENMANAHRLLEKIERMQ